MKMIKPLVQTTRTKQLYLSILSLIVIGLSLSPFLVGFSQVLLFIWWLWSGKFAEKYENLKQNFHLLFWVSILFLIPLISLTYSENISWGIKQLVVKFPIFALAVAFASSQRLKSSEIKFIENIFILALFISMLIGTYAGINRNGEVSSVFISHIRQSLFISLAIFILIGRLILSNGKIRVQKLMIYFFTITCFVTYLLLLTAMTGILISITLSLVFLIVYAKKIWKNTWLRLLYVIIPLLLVYPLYLTYSITKQFINKPKMESLNPDRRTINGNKYKHHWPQTMLENGNYVGIYVCEPELRPLWNSASKFDFDTTNKNGHLLKHRIFRYMTSKNLRKDSLGFTKLTKLDINLIEQGFSNYLFAKKNPFYIRIYQLIWELHQYINGANPSGNSLTQRFEFWKAAIYLIKQNFWFGVGAGDLQTAYQTAYNEINSPLQTETRLRAHNQYLTYWVSSGIIGFSLFCLALIMIAVLTKNPYQPQFLVTLIIILMSMLTEDTFETQAGVLLMAFFMNLYIFNPRK